LSCLINIYVTSLKNANTNMDVLRQKIMNEPVGNNALIAVASYSYHAMIGGEDEVWGEVIELNPGGPNPQ